MEGFKEMKDLSKLRKDEWVLVRRSDDISIGLVLQVFLEIAKVKVRCLKQPNGSGGREQVW